MVYRLSYITFTMDSDYFLGDASECLLDFDERNSKKVK
jgi:hypothetical protein